MKSIILIAAILAVLPVTLLAEGKGNQDWAEKAARGYEMKAKSAAENGKPAEAAIYRRMAEIKREAGRASKRGKEFSWEEYHKLEGKLQNIRQEHAKHEDKKHKKHKEKPGEGFLRTAEEYRKKAHLARKDGDTDKAKIYGQLAEMKVAAAEAARNGKGYDWTRYHELKKKLHKGDEHPKHKEWEHKKERHEGKPAKLNIE